MQNFVGGQGFNFYKNNFFTFVFFGTFCGLLTINNRQIIIYFLQIKIYKPNGGKGCPLGSQPPALPPSESAHLKHFAHETLPKKLWRKYSYASLFVTNIKAKTPKVTLYTKRAKFQLMENGDVEVTFYNGKSNLITVLLHLI